MRSRRTETGAGRYWHRTRAVCWVRELAAIEALGHHARRPQTAPQRVRLLLAPFGQTEIPVHLRRAPSRLSLTNQVKVFHFAPLNLPCRGSLPGSLPAGGAASPVSRNYVSRRSWSWALTSAKDGPLMQ